MGSKLIADLLSSAQPHIPPLGFTLQAIQAGAHHSGLASSSVVAELFPSTSTIGASLLRRFDEEHWEQYSKRSTQHTNQTQAYDEAISSLRSKLLASVPVRDKLPDALASLVSTRVSSLPFSLPNPSPVLHRAYSIADEALHIAGWNGSLSTDWYARRLALSTSYMLAELHMISPEQQSRPDITPSLALFNRLTGLSTAADDTPGAGAGAGRGKGDFPPLHQWANWGSYGWLGILRSHGL